MKTLKHLAIATAILLLPLLSACTVNPATGKQSFTAFMSPEREKEIGRQEHEKILDQYGVYDDPELGAYIARLGGMLAKNSELPDLNFTFTVLNDPLVNAFALPGGYVYITRGILTITANEAELVSVLGHEIGHVTARHTAQRYSATVATNLGLQVLGVIGSVVGIPGGSGQLASIGAQIALQSYSREQELESDVLGMRYMTRAGYDPDAMAGFFQKLKARTALADRMSNRKDSTDNFSIMSTHPLTSERISESIKQAQLVTINGRTLNREVLQSRIDGMMFGDDPKQGVVRGRTFEHPELGIRFEVPPGFTLINQPKQVVAYGPKGAVIVFALADLAKVRKARDLRDYIDRYAFGRTRAGDVEALRINGLDAATGRARVNVNNKVYDARSVAIRQNRTTVYNLLFLSPPATTQSLVEDYRRATYSFRELSSREAAAIKPLRIGFRTVQEGDTVESLSRLMPIENFAVDWFELLNDVKADQSLVPGSRVKVVVE